MPDHSERTHFLAEPSAKRVRIRARRGASCRVCRTRKLKCDGVKPRCTRCQRSGEETECVYDLEVKRRSRIGSPSSDDDAETLEATPVASLSSPGHKISQSERIMQLERTVARLRAEILADKAGEQSQAVSQPKQTTDLTGFHSVGHPLEPYVGAPMQPTRHARIAHEAAFRTFYWGSAHWGVAPVGGMSKEHETFFAEIKTFITRHPMLTKALGEMKQFDLPKKEAKRVRPFVHNSDDYSLRNQLPPKDEVDRLVNLYLDTMENVYHVLHVPSFRHQYAAFWEQSLEQQTNSPLIVIILLMLSCVICVNEPADLTFRGDDAANRAKAVQWIIACDDWSQFHSQKYLTLPYFQTKCLLLIAKMIVGTHIKRWYIEVCTLMRLAISVGMHLEVEGTKIGSTMSEFDKEMRRRIWAVIVELELYFCYLRGLPTILTGLQATCHSLKDIHDEDLTKDGSPSRISHDSSHPHKTVSYLVVASKSQDLRLKLLYKLNGPNHTPEQSEVLQLEDEITAALRQCDTLQHQLQRSHLRMLLLRMLLMLYRNASHLAASNSFRDYATHRCTKLAADIVREHQTMSPTTRLLITYQQATIFISALSLCLDLYVAATKNPNETPHNPADLTSLIQSALDVMETRVLRIGGIHRRYWLLLVAFSTTQAKLAPAGAKSIDDRAAEKLMSMLYKIISLQALDQLPAQGSVVAEGASGGWEVGEFGFGEMPGLSWDAFLTEWNVG